MLGQVCGEHRTDLGTGRLRPVLLDLGEHIGDDLRVLADAVQQAGDAGLAGEALVVGCDRGGEHLRRVGGGDAHPDEVVDGSAERVVGAGGTLAALAGVGWNANPTGALGRTERVDGWVAFAGIMDFTGAGRIPDTLGRAWLGPNTNQKAWYRAASPIGHLDPAVPPGYLVHGDLDPIVEIAQMDRMISAANAAKVPAGRIHYDRVDTGPSACRGHTPACGANADAFDSWIDKVAARRL